MQEKRIQPKVVITQNTYALRQSDLHRNTVFDIPSAGIGAIARPPFQNIPSVARALNVARSSGARIAPLRVDLPEEIGFLVHYGLTASSLMDAAERASMQAITPDAALLAEGVLSEDRFYRSLAHHLRLVFIDGPAVLAKETQYPQAIHAGVAPVARCDGFAFLVAPRGKAIRELSAALRRNRASDRRLAITTPTHLSRLVRAAARDEISRAASFALQDRDAALSAHEGITSNQLHAAFAIACGLALLSAFAPSLTLVTLRLLAGLLFLATSSLRLAATAATVNAPTERLRPLSDAALPPYSIVIALYNEARVVPQIVSAVHAIDYPRGKLDVKIVVEHDDIETIAALQMAQLPNGWEIIVAPAGLPRTKPRALNVALPLARGRLIVVFDAEDVPDPAQLKRAAMRFAAAPDKLACLQAQLAIDTIGDGWLGRLFAVEYAALFDVINRGLSKLRLPFPLGGSSNHFRGLM